MEWIGWVCFIIIICYSSYPGKVKKLEREMKKLKRNQTGGIEMSKIISALIGKKCRIKTDNIMLFNGNNEQRCIVLDVDDEWIKIEYMDKNKNQKIKILRIESIDNIESI